MSLSYDVIVAGGGPVGLACAISLAKDGRRVAVVERVPEPILARPPFDGREIALTHHASSWLKQAGAWQHIPSEAISPLRNARIESGHDLQNASRRALLFRAPEHGPDALGHLVANHLIRGALYQAAKGQPRLTLLTGKGIAQTSGHRHEAALTLDDGTRLSSELIVAADGRFSQIRSARGIGAIVHDFHRSILVCRMRHPLPHEQVALQWFDEGQTIALLPVAPDDLPGDRSSLVLTLPPDDIARLKNLDEDAFNKDITERTQGRLGDMTLESARCVYPLKAVYAHRFEAERLALIGDAAVGMHPITAHGFNLGLKGQETLTQAIADGPGDAGASSVLRRYEWKHRLATAPLFAATNGIATVYTHDAMPILALRQAGLRFAENLAPFKNFVSGLLMDRNRAA